MLQPESWGTFMGPKSPKIVPGDSVPHLAGMESPGTIFAGLGPKKGVPLLGLYSCTLVGVVVPSPERCDGIRSGSTCCVLRLGEFSHRVRDEFESLRLEFSAEQM